MRTVAANTTQSSPLRIQGHSAAVGAPKPPDFSQIMAHLADAIAFIRVSHRSLDHLDVAFEEQTLLRMGLAALDAVYTEIDLASIALSKKVSP